MLRPTPGRFAALARSSPWRWSTLRLTHAERLHGRSRTVRAWIRRPDCLRVERLPGGAVLQAGCAPPGPVSVPLVATAGGPAAGAADRRRPEPELDADGLVRSRPGRWAYDHTDDPMFENYRWVALLDPAELADGVDGEPPVEIDELAAVEHHGRPAWEAVLRPTPAYDPRCSCCPLLLSAESDHWEVAAGAPSLLEARPGLRFADAHRVRLDVATGVCVLTAEIGGDRPGEGHDARIEAVDAPLPDALFR